MAEQRSPAGKAGMITALSQVVVRASEPPGNAQISQVAEPDRRRDNSARR